MGMYLDELYEFDIIAFLALLDGAEKQLIEEDFNYVKGETTWENLKKVQNYNEGDFEALVEFFKNDIGKLNYKFYHCLEDPNDAFSHTKVPVFQKFEVNALDGSMTIKWLIREEHFELIYNLLTYMSNAVDLDHIRDAETEGKKG